MLVAPAIPAISYVGRERKKLQLADEKRKNYRLALLKGKSICVQVCRTDYLVFGTDFDRIRTFL